MTFVMADKLRYIAEIARKKSEEIVEAHDYLWDNMCGFCARGSAILFNELEKRGYKPEIVEGRSHFYVMCNGYIIDITATQFGSLYPRVLVRKELTKHMIEEIGAWKITNKFNSIEEARTAQINDGWSLEETISWEDLEQ